MTKVLLIRQLGMVKTISKTSKTCNVTNLCTESIIILVIKGKVSYGYVPLMGKGGTFYKKHGLFCLMPQNFPDAINHVS